MSDRDTAPAETAPAETPDLNFVHLGEVGDLFSITAINGLLNIVTLFIYRFWAKTRVRAYLWSRTTLGGDAMEYSGTGKEMFHGFLAALGAVILPLVLLNLVGAFMPGILSDIFDVVYFLLIIFLIGIAQYRARRYRLSRTHWRGIRAAQTGSEVEYGLKTMGFYLLLPLTLTWSYPWQAMCLMSHMMNNTWFGDRRFSFKGSAGPLYMSYGIAWMGMAVAVLFPVAVVVGTGGFIPDSSVEGGLNVNGLAMTAIFLAILTLPLIYAWFLAEQYRHMASCTRYEGLCFTFEATGSSLVKLALGNMAVMIITLGFGLAFTQMRKFRYFCDHMLISGDADFEAIRQSTELRPSVGEGLADAFDVGGI